MDDDLILQKLRDIRTILDEGYTKGMHLSAARCRMIVDVLDAVRREVYGRRRKAEDES